jgi:ABC-type Fe3+ transport system substrate-binding protein
VEDVGKRWPTSSTATAIPVPWSTWPASASSTPPTNQDEAERLVEYLLSEEAQEYFAEETFEIPVIDGVSPPAELPDLDASRCPTSTSTGSRTSKARSSC